MAIPHEYRAAIPDLNVPDGATAVDFYERAFGARTAVRLHRPDGRLAHAELRIGDAQVMVPTEIPELGFRAPTKVGGTPTQIPTSRTSTPRSSPAAPRSTSGSADRAPSSPPRAAASRALGAARHLIACSPPQ